MLCTRLLVLNNSMINKLYSGCKIFFLSLILILAGKESFSATRIASVSGLWSSTATWGGNPIPTSADVVTINSGIAVTVDIPATCSTLTFATAAASNSLTISGTNSLTVTGLITMPRPATGFNSTIAVGAGALSAGSLTMSATTTSRPDIISISTGTVTISGLVTTGTTGCQFNFTGAGLLRFGGTFSGGPAALTPSTGTVEYTSASPVIQGFSGSYYNLLFSGTGTTTGAASGTISIQGNLTSSAGGIFNFTSRAVTLSGTATANSIAGFTTTGTVSMTKTAGTATFTGNVNGGGFTLNGLGGTLSLGTGLTHTFTGTWTRSNGTLNAVSSILNLGGSVSGTTGTFTAGTGTVNYYGAVSQTGAVLTYNNLTISGAGTKTFSTTPTVNGILSLEGTAIIVVSTGVVTYGANATLKYNTATSRTVTSEEWITPFAATGGVIIANTGIITLNTAKVFNTSIPLTINSGASLATANSQLTFGGDFHNSGTFTAGSSAIVITGTSVTQSIDGFTTTGSVSMTKTAGIATFASNVNAGALTINGSGGTLNLGVTKVHTFGGIITLTAGTLNGGSSMLNENGVSATAWNGTGSLFVAGTGTVNFGGAGAQTISSTATIFNNVTFSNSGVKTLTTANFTVNGVLSMEGSATASAAPTYGASATLRYNTATARTVGAEWIATFLATGGVVIGNTGVITLNGNKVFNTSIPLNINSGASLNTSVTNYSLTFGGDFLNNGGTFTANGSPILFSGGAATQSIDGFTTTGTVSMTKSSGTATLNGNVSGGGLTINGTGGTLDLGTGLTHTFSGTWTRTAGTLLGGSNLLRIGGSVSGTGGTFTAGSGTVEWYAAGAQTLAIVSYNNLSLTGSGIKSIATGTTVAGDLSITGALAGLGSGVNISVGSLILGGVNKISGTWGSSGSSATNKDDTYFTSTGIITVTQSGCSGIPTPGNTISTSTLVCSGAPFMLSLQIPGTALTYQWQSSPDGIAWSNVTPAPTTLLTTDFTTQPSNTNVYGASTIVTGGELILTPAILNYSGGYVIQTTTGSNITPFTVSYDYRMFDGTGADGMSLSYASNIANTAGGGEVGEGSGLIVAFDSYDNVASTTSSQIRIIYAGTQVWANAVGAFNLRNTSYRNMTVTVDGNGDLSLSIAGTLIVSGILLPGYAAADKTTWKFKFSGRTGSLSDKQSIDNLLIKMGDNLSVNSTLTTTQTASNYYKCNVTCSGNTIASNPLLVSIVTAPTFTVAPAASVCASSDVTYTTESGQSAYVWTVPGVLNTDYTIKSGGTGSTDNTVTLKWLSSGSKTVTVNYSNSAGCTGLPAATTTSTVNPLPVAAGAITGTPVVCQESSTVSYSVPAITNATSYVWDYSGTGASITGTTNSVTITFDANATSGDLTVYGNNSCGDGATSAIYTITVNPLPDPAGTITGISTICQNQSAGTYNVPAIANATSYVWDYSGTGVTFSGATNSITLTFDANSISGDLTVTGQNSCGLGNVSATYPITVNPLPDPPGTITGTSTVCQGTATVAYTVPVIPDADTYNWVYSGTGATITGGGTNSITITFAANATSGNLTVYGSNALCGSGPVSANYAITVNPATTISSQSTATQSQCIPGTFTPITVTAAGTGTLTYQWFSNTTASTSSGTSLLAANGAQTNSYTPQVTAVGTLYYYCIVSGTCGTVTSSISGAFIVNPASVGGTISGGVTEVCQGGATGTMTLSGYSGVIQRWERQVNSLGWNSVGFGGATTYSETPFSGGNWQYRAVVQNGSCPIAYSSIATVLVDSTTTSGTLGGGTTPICQGSSTGVLTLGASTGRVVQWEKRVNSGAWSIIANTTRNYSETPSSGGTWDYRVLVQSGICTTVYSNILSIVVNPTLSITLGANPVICKGTTVALLNYTATTGSPSAYSITFDAAAITAGMSNIAGWGLTASPISINVPFGIAAGVYNALLSVATTFPVCSSITYPITLTVQDNTLPVTISGSATPCQGSSQIYSCTSLSGATYNWVFPSGWTQTAGGTSNSVTVTVGATSGNVQVTPAFTCGSGIARTLAVTPFLLATATISYTGTPFCSSLSTPQSVTLSGTSGGSYTASPAGLTINSSTGAITPSTSNSGTYTVTYSVASPGGCGVITANTSVTIMTLPVTSFSYSGTPYCANAANPSPTFSGGGIAGTFSSTTGLNFVNTATGQINLATSTPGTYTVTNTIIASGGCSSSISTSSVTINPLTALSSQSTGTQTQCLGGTFSAITATATGTSLSYQWYSNATATTSGGTSLGTANGANTNSYTPQTSTAGTLYYYCIISGTCGSVTTAVSGAFIVNTSLPASVVIAAVPTGSICSGTSVTFTATPTNGGTTPSYQWKVNGTNAGTNASTYAYSPANNDAVTCVMTSNATCATGNPATSNILTITVNPLPAIGLTVGGTGSICSGSGTNITVALSVSGINYQLRNNTGNVAVGTAVAGTGGTINLPTGNLSATTTFNVLATNATTSCSAQLTNTATVTINPLPSIGLTVGGTGSLCSGSATNITVALSVVGTSYQLRNNTGNTLIGTAVNGTGGTINLPTGNLSSTTTFNILATISSTSCSAQLTNTATVTVNPLPAVGLTVGGTGTVCSGTGTNITVALSVSGINYQLRNNTGNVAVGTAVAGTGGTINLPTGNLSTTTTFNVLATNATTSCSAQLTGTTTLTVNPLPAVGLTVGGTGTICSGTATNITVASSVSGVNYQLRNNAGNATVGSAVAGTGGTINLPTGNLTTTTTFNILATNATTTCSAQLTGTATVTVNPSPAIGLTVGGSGSICSGSGTNITVALSVSGTSYQLRNSTGNVNVGSPVTGTGGTINLPTGNLTTATTFNVLATIVSTSCSAQLTGTATITINGLAVPTFTAQPGANACSGIDVTYTTQSGQTNYIWVLPGVLNTDYSITSGGIGTTSNTVTLKWLTTGSKTVTINYNNTSGCSGSSAVSSTATTVNALPAPTFTVQPGAAACIGIDVTYTTQSGQSNYVWVVPGVLNTDYSITSGGTGTASNTVTLKWLTTGSKTVTVNYTNASSCTATSATSSTATTVNALPAPTFTVQPGASVCIGINATYTTQAGQTSYVWVVPGVLNTDYTITSGGVGATSNTVTLKWLTTGSKTVTINYTNSGGCTAVSATSSTPTTVNSLPAPTFTAQPGATACIGIDVTYTTQSGQSNYVWVVPGILNTDYSITSGSLGVASNTVTLNWLTTGSKTVTINYSNLNGCTAAAVTSSTATTVNALPVPTFTTQPGASACIGIDVTYTTQSGQTNYIWVIPGVLNTDYSITSGGIGTASNTVTLKWLTTGSKSVTVNYTNASGCTAVSPVSGTPTTVNALPVPTFTTQAGASACIGIDVTYTTQSGQSNYIWVVPGILNTDYSISSGGLGTTSNTVTLKWLTTGSKTVTINYSNASGCTAASTTSSTATTVNALPVPTFTTQPGASACIGIDVTYTTQSGQTNYIWVVPGVLNTDYSITSGGVGTTSNTVTLKWLTTGSKSVTLNYTNVSGCTAVSPISSTPTTVNALPLPTFTLQPGTSVCIATDVTYTTQSAQSNYVWVVPGVLNTDYSITSGSVGSTSNTVTLKWITTGSKTVSVNYSNGNGCTAAVATLSIATTVNPATAITGQSTLTQTTCLNSPFSPITVTATGTGTLTYQWYKNTTASTTGGTSLVSANGAQTNSYTPQSNLAGTLYYYCIVHGDCGTDITSSISGAFITIADLTWTGLVSSDWNTIGNWSCPYLPDLTISVLITSGVPNMPILSSGATGMAKNIVINGSSSLTVTGNILQIAGSITNSGTFTASGGTIEMKGSTAQTIVASTFAGNTIQNLTVTNSSGVTLSGPLNITGIVKATTGNLSSSGNLKLVSSAAQTALIDGTGTGDVLGNVTMQRYLPSAFGYRYFSSPFQSATVNEFANDLNLSAAFPSFYKYDEDNHRDSLGVAAYSSGWVNYTTTSGSLVPLHGYAANFGSATPAVTADMTGVVNNGSVSASLLNHNRKYTKGFNLVGNPYPSPIDWNASSGWTKSNIDNALYFFNPGNTDQYTGVYSSYVGGVSTGNGSNLIASMQGFFVHVSDGSYPVTGTLGMTNSVRTNDLAPVFRDAFIDPRTILRFTANLETNNAIEDVSVLYFDEMANRSFNKELDALKMLNTDPLVPNLYSISPDARQLSIKGIPAPTDSISRIPLGLLTLTDSWISFNAIDISQLPASLYIYLADAEKGITQDLKKLPEYRFYLKSGSYNQRFSLVFSLSELTKTAAVPEKLFKLTNSASLIMITMNLPFNAKGNLFVTNMSGQVILRRTVGDRETVEINSAASTGLYIITVISGSNQTSEKILIRKDYE